MNRSGFSLVEVLVSVAILGLLVMLIMSITDFSHKEVASDERLGEGMRAGVFIANSLRELGFLELVKRCQDEGIFQVPPSAASGCLSAPNTLTTATAAPSAGLIPLKVRVSSAGDADANGKYCVEMKSCNLLADGHLVAVNITTVWIGVNDTPRFTNHQIRVLR